jgi:hypothetical protein
LHTGRAQSGDVFIAHAEQESRKAWLSVHWAEER